VWAAKTYATGRKRHDYPKDRKRRWPRERVIERIQTWAAEHDGRPPRYDEWHPSRRPHPDWEKYVWPSSYVLQQMFGSWSNAIEAAGFPKPQRGRKT
jgi:hypothetical protein